jgi:hypothetical protein
MLSAIRYWCQATQLTTPSERSVLDITPLGSALLRNDPYLEDSGTLWIIHHELASNKSKATFWYWMFNELDTDEIDEDSAVEAFQQWLMRNYPEIESVSEQSIRKDWSCFLRTYTSARRNELWDEMQSPLASLQLAERVSNTRITFHIGRKLELSTAILLGHARAL